MHPTLRAVPRCVTPVQPKRKHGGETELDRTITPKHRVLEGDVAASAPTGEARRLALAALSPNTQTGTLSAKNRSRLKPIASIVVSNRTFPEASVPSPSLSDVLERLSEVKTCAVAVDDSGRRVDVTCSIDTSSNATEVLDSSSEWYKLHVTSDAGVPTVRVKTEVGLLSVCTLSSALLLERFLSQLQHGGCIGMKHTVFVKRGHEERLVDLRDRYMSELDFNCYPMVVRARTCRRFFVSEAPNDTDTGARMETCAECKRAYERLRKSIQRRERSTNDRTAPSSHTKHTAMTREELVQKCNRQHILLEATTQRNKALQEQLRKRDDDVSPDSTGDLDGLWEAVQDETTSLKKTLNDVAPQHRHRIERLWQEQKELASSGQLGGRGQKYSDELIRIMLSVYVRSRQAYQELRDSGILTLPSGRVLDRVLAAQRPAQGVSGGGMRVLLDARRVFEANHKRTGKPTPQFKGCLFYDEMRLQCGLSYAPDGSIRGFACSVDELVTLVDLYKRNRTTDTDTSSGDEVNSDEHPRAKYALAFMYRDLTSAFSAPVAYYLTPKSITAEWLTAQWLEVFNALEMADFHCIATCGDGASQNLAFWKLFCNIGGPLKRRTMGVDGRLWGDLECEPTVRHPYARYANEQLIFLMDPSHSLKNCRNWLHSSREKGSKTLRWEGADIAWQTFVTLWQEDYQAASRNGTLRDLNDIPRASVYLNSWSKMNVKYAAKTMINPTLCGKVAEMVQSTPELRGLQAYLNAALDIFQPLMSKTALTTDSVERIEQGYRWFLNWRKSWESSMERHLQQPGQTQASYQAAPGAAKGPKAHEREYIAVCSLQELSVMVKGIRALFNVFQRPDMAQYQLFPRRVNQDCVENLFSWIRSGASTNPSAEQFASRFGTAVAKGRLDAAKNSTYFQADADESGDSGALPSFVRSRAELDKLIDSGYAQGMSLFST